MNQLKRSWKILFLSITLILISYLVVIFFLTDSSEKISLGDTWEVYKGDQKVLWLQNQPGFLVSTALLPPGIEPIKHLFVNAKALDPFEEDDLQKLLSQSKSFEEYLSLLRDNGYLLKKVNQ